MVFFLFLGPCFEFFIMRMHVGSQNVLSSLKSQAPVVT